MVDVPVYADSRETVKHPIKTTVMLDNSKEKKAAIDMFSALYDLYDKLKAKASMEEDTNDGEYATIMEQK
jgi:hypothetical protein